MAESESDFTEPKPVVLGPQYTPTDEELKVFKQCDSESFWYRSVPFSAGAVALTHILVTKGMLKPSERFGSLPKILIAGLCGYFAGKLSYMQTCQEKFSKLENSPIGEALRQRQQTYQHPPQFTAPHAEEENPQFEAFQSQYSPPDFGLNDSIPSTEPQPLNTHGLDEDEEVKKKPVLYEELRNRNRENYDIIRSQKIDTDIKTEVKKNKYGDAWEE